MQTLELHDTRLPYIATDYGTIPIKIVAASCKSVEGSVAIRGNCHLHLPLCEHIAGDVYVFTGGAIYLPKCLKIDGQVRVYHPATFYAPLLSHLSGYPGKLLAVHSYPLWQDDLDGFHAGCRHFKNKAEALAHWENRTDPRAVTFTAALKASKRSLLTP